MAEGSYESECMRAELLGVAKPTYEEFLQNKKDSGASGEEGLEEEIDLENVEKVEHQSEVAGGLYGKLDELNNILKGTQNKINRFKATCGSFSSFLKTKIRGDTNDPTPESGDDSNFQSSSNIEDHTNVNEGQDNVNDKTNAPTNGTPSRKSDLSRALDKNIDKLDALIDKANTAEISMSAQTKQMRRII